MVQIRESPKTCVRLQFLVILGLGSIRGMAEQNAKKQEKYVHAFM